MGERATARWRSARRGGRRRSGRYPTRRIRRAKAGVVVELRDLPDAVFLAIAHLVDAFGPGCTSGKAAEGRERAPAPTRTLSVRVQVHDGLDAHVVVEASVPEPHLPHRHIADVAIQVFPDALLADVDAGRIVRHGILREVLGKVGPHALVEVVTVAALQALYRLQVLGGLDLGFQHPHTRRKARPGRRRSFGIRAHGHCAEKDE